MTPFGYLFYIAIKLALLTFYIGVLIFALPLPFRGVKRWGGSLVRDSIFSFALALSLTGLMQFSDELARMLGGSWVYFDQWLTGGLDVVLSLKVAVTAISGVLSYAPGLSGVRALLGPLNDALTADILFMITLLVIEFMVRNAGGLVALLGLVLFSVPFRLGREAGAWFIAFVLTFSVGLQVLPAFVSYVAESPQVNVTAQGANWGVTYVTAQVLSGTGGPVGDAVVEIYVTSGGSGKLVAQYVTNREGTPIDPYAGEPGLISIPSQVPVYAYVVDDGWQFALTPFPYSPMNSSPSVTFTAPDILYSNGYNVIAFTDSPGSVNASVTSEGGVFRISMWYAQIFEIRAPDNCSVNVTSTFPMGTGSWEWDGIRGKSWFLLGPMNATVWLKVNNCGQASVKGVKTIDYAVTSFGLNGLSVNVIEDLLIYYFTVPLMYVAVLTSVTYALARLLGGRRGIMPRLT
ncbi:MAG: hypothetical protein ACP5HK_00900 [Acidilobus sp.]